MARAVIVPTLFSKAFDAPEASDAIRTTYHPDGAVVQYDHAAHALMALLPGGTATITADKVTSDAPSTICTGDLTVNGATALNGGVKAKADRRCRRHGCGGARHRQGPAMSGFSRFFSLAL